MSSLFDSMREEHLRTVAPLAARMRPTSLDEYVGQEEVVGKDTWLRRVIDADALSSILLFGPAGTGKTTLARIIANDSHAHFEELSAVTSGVTEVRRAIQAASDRLAMHGQRSILFIDEIHRFSKSQQDALLHAVEDRIITLVGATTENPYFEVNPPLVSRSRVVELKPLKDEDISAIVERALSDERGLGNRYAISDEALKAIVHMSGGDARVALTTLELSAQLTQEGAEIGVEAVTDVLPTRQLPYDKKGDNHYDVISAFIKSMRGSNPNAAVYWLAHMLYGGEDPKFIARRMMIFASEDVGNADPRALLIAEAAFRSAEIIGMPECRINLSQAAVYMALAPKSNASYLAIDAAMSEVARGIRHEVPPHLRDRHRPGSEEYGPYLYPHDFKHAWVEQSYLPSELAKKQFFKANPRGWERDMQSTWGKIMDGKDKEDQEKS